MTTPSTFEATAATFAQDVVEASRSTPILVDFWASWCGPCRTLGPILEKLAEDTGAFRLAKVDTESEQQLAAMFQIQSIPYVVAFVGGRPVDAFVGALDEQGIRAFLEKVGVDLTGAAAPEEAPPPDTPLNKASALLRGRRLDELERVEELLEGIEEDEDDYARARRLLEAMPFFRGQMAAEGKGSALAVDARTAWIDGDEPAAMQGLLDCVRADARWDGEIGRKGLVALMQLHDEHDELVQAIRRKLAVILY